MSSEKDRWPEDANGVIRRLQDGRPQMEALEMDRIKTRIMARDRTRGTKGASLKGRMAIAAVTVGLLGAGAGGVAALSGGSAGGASAASAQYRPRCGDDFHRNEEGRCVRNRHHHRRHHRRRHHHFSQRPHSGAQRGFTG